MNIAICYNAIVAFDPKKFRDYIRNKFAEWRGLGRESLADYAAHIGISQQVVSNWYNGKLKNRPEPSTYLKLVEKYGPEVYGFLDLSQPDLISTLSQSFPNMSQSVRERLAAALAEINDRSAGIPEGDPRLDVIVRDALKQNGFKL